jgi:arginyl-tRNA synthetase
MFQIVQTSLTTAISEAFPELPDTSANISRCSNPQFGDFQCNNAMSIAKMLNGSSGKEN